MRKNEFSWYSDKALISFTTDIWTSDVCPMPLLSISAHWTDSSFGQKGPEQARQATKDMLNMWEPDILCNHVIMDDNAQGEKKELMLLGFKV